MSTVLWCYTVDLVIFAFFSSEIIIINFERFLYSRICPLREIREYYQIYSISDFFRICVASVLNL